ncbi:MAG: transposase [Leptospirales bacterium]
MSSSQPSSLLERIQASSEKDRACIAALLTGWFGALGDPLFVDKHRVSKTDFTRVRQLTFLRVVLFCLISFARSSVREALELIFSKGQSPVKVAPVTPSALCQALQTISHSAFIDANTILVSRFRKTDLPRTWHRFRVTTIDGSNLNLPRFKALMEAFVPGVDPSLPGSTAARLSLLLDVTNGLVLGARVGIHYLAKNRCLFFRSPRPRCVPSEEGFPCAFRLPPLRNASSPLHNLQRRSNTDEPSVIFESMNDPLERLQGVNECLQ